MCPTTTRTKILFLQRFLAGYLSRPDLWGPLIRCSTGLAFCEHESCVFPKSYSRSPIKRFGTFVTRATLFSPPRDLVSSNSTWTGTATRVLFGGWLRCRFRDNDQNSYEVFLSMRTITDKHACDCDSCVQLVRE